MKEPVSLFRVAVALCACILLVGCASKISQQLPRMTTLAEAKAAFGPPQSSKKTADGTVAHEWGFDQTEFVPGQYVTQKIYMGHDRDGYRKYYEREIWVPAHRSGRYCHILIETDAAGLLLRSAYQGNACDSLFRPDAVR